MRLLMIVFCIAGFLIPFDPSDASPVGVDVAIQVALNWCEERGPTSVGEFAVVDHVVVGEVEPLFFIFN